MAFVNTWITPEDVEKYELKQDYEVAKHRIGVYSNLKISEIIHGNQWTVDKGRDLYLRRGGRGNAAFGVGEINHHYFLLNWRGHYLFPVIKYEENCKDDKEKKISYLDCILIGEFIPQNLNDFKFEILQSLKEALDCYGAMGIISNYKYKLTFKF